MKLLRMKYFIVIVIIILLRELRKGKDLGPIFILSFLTMYRHSEVIDYA